MKAFNRHEREQDMTSEDFTREIMEMEDTLYRICRTQLSCPADREDAVQEALRRAWEKRDRLREGRYLKTWVVRILLNVCRDMQRRGKRETPMDALPDKAVSQEDRALLDALWSLEDKLRLPIVLHCIEGYPVEETAAILRLPQGTVKSRISRGKRCLRELLSEEVFDE